MVEAVMQLWDTGLDTERIATVLRRRQHEVERALHAGLEQRRKERHRETQSQN